MKTTGLTLRTGLALLFGAVLIAATAGPSMADPAEDQRIKDRVKNRLEGQVSLSIEGLEIEVVNGEVVISGSVGSIGEIDTVRRIVNGVSDVRYVRTNLSVRASGRSQADIEQEVRKVLDRRQRFRALEVRASGGEVTLTGQVDRAIDQYDAEVIVASVSGVTKVVNQIEILRGQDTPEEILARVESILRNPLTFGVVRDLSVSLDDGIVTLQGVAASDKDRLEAQRLTLSVPGVGGVNNQIVVTGS